MSDATCGVWNVVVPGHIENAPAPQIMRNRTIASNPRLPMNYAAITRKASGSGIQLREACRKRDKGRRSGHPGQ